MIEPGLEVRRTAAFIRHVHHEDGGTLAAFLQSIGWTIRYVEAPSVHNEPERLASLGADLLVVLGGAISTKDQSQFPFITVEIDILKQRLKSDLPTVGICLGAQLLATAAGGSVESLKCREIGWDVLTLTAAGRGSPLEALEGVSVLHWHGEFVTLPNQTQSLASTSLCQNQAFMFGKACLGLQFHPEVTTFGLESWYIANMADLEASEWRCVNSFRELSERLGPHLEARAPIFWARVMTALGIF